ncbi:receptor-transporting protein 3-like [Pseudophryne corroboree]|uniref:receptor-transporting protein 3-like n=1 Tax=Pseudophryne corroboree TaxID=495146 RepID=UPI003081AF53
MASWTWNTLFENELEDQGIPHEWSFSAEDNLKAQQGYLQNTQCTFARFQCSRCARWWKSAKVHILFLIRRDRQSRRGTVRMRIFKQKCRRCTFAVWEKAEIPEENIKRVISNLVSKIHQMVYMRNSGKALLPPLIDSDDIEGPHDVEHCEACKENACQWQAGEGDIRGTAMITDMRGSVNQPQSAQSQRRVQDEYDSSWFTARPPTTAHQTHNEQNVMLTLLVVIVFVVLFMSAIGFSKH